MKAHPVADLFPLLSEQELDDLASDIKANGLLHPIVLDDDGSILDGRNRFLACELAGIEPSYESYDGDDPDAYALTVNINRRHLTKGQIAMVAARAGNLVASTNRRLAEAVSVNREYVNRASTVLHHDPDLAEQVVAGTLSLNDAYQRVQERKQEAQRLAAERERLRSIAPDLDEQVSEEVLALTEALTEAKQREEDRRGAIRRAQDRLRELVNGWIELETLPDHPERDDILAGLIHEDRQTVLAIESIYQKGTA